MAILAVVFTVLSIISTDATPLVLRIVYGALAVAAFVLTIFRCVQIRKR